jgi:hypothetical protein
VINEQTSNIITFTIFYSKTDIEASYLLCHRIQVISLQSLAVMHQLRSLLPLWSNSRVSRPHFQPQLSIEDTGAGSWIIVESSSPGISPLNRDSLMPLSDSTYTIFHFCSSPSLYFRGAGVDYRLLHIRKHSFFLEDEPIVVFFEHDS